MGKLDQALTLFHYPKCSKSKLLHGYLTEKQIPFQIRNYHEGLKEEEVHQLLAGICKYQQMISQTQNPNPTLVELGMVRKNDTDWPQDGNEQIVHLVKHPQFLERPILFKKDVGVVCRPDVIAIADGFLDQI